MKSSKQITISNSSKHGPRLTIAKKPGTFAEDVRHVKPAPLTHKRFFHRALGTR